MDLDDFKSEWQQQTNQDETVLSEQQIEALLQSRTKGTIGQLKRNLWIDFAIMVVFSVVLLFCTFYISKKNPAYARGVYVLIGVLALGYSIFTAYSWMRLRQVIKPKDTLKSALEKLVRRIENGMLGMRIASVLAPTIGLLYARFLIQGTAMFEFLPLLKILGIGLVIGLLYYPLANWYVKKMAGTQCEELKSCLKELEE